MPWGLFMACSRRLPLSYNEKTYGAPGYGRDYTSLALWEDDTDNDLVTAQKGEVLTCYDDAAPYTDFVTLAGATTNENYFRVIRAASGQRGTRTSGVRFYRSYDQNHAIISLNENYASVHDIGVSGTYTGTSTIVGVQGILISNSGTKVIGATVYDIYGGIAAGIHNTNTSGTTYIVNCHIYHVEGTMSFAGLSAGIRRYSGGGTTRAYNCTVTNCTQNGLRKDFGYFYATNCVVQGCGAAYYGSPGITKCVSAGVVFESDGYHLSASDTVAKDQGNDLSADPYYAFDDDIDGGTRSGSWDIGCDEYGAFAPVRKHGAALLL